MLVVAFNVPLRITLVEYFWVQEKKKKSITWDTACSNKHNVEIQFGCIIFVSVQITIVVFGADDYLVR